MKLSRAQQVALAVLAIAFALLVWPTRYRYEHVQGGTVRALVRIDRVTGRLECFNGRRRPPEASTVDTLRSDPLDVAWDAAHPQGERPKALRANRQPQTWLPDCY